jgi:TRAP transporter TAXI family solute receptor
MQLSNRKNSVWITKENGIGSIKKILKEVIMRSTGKLIICIFSVALAISLVSLVPQPTLAKTIDILYGGTGLSSGSYVRPVAVSKVIEKYVPGTRVTVVATGSSRDNLIRLGKKTIDIAGIAAVDTCYQAYNGVGRFKGKGIPNARALWIDSAAVLFFAVRADTGLKTLADLEGKKVFLGPPGSSVELTMSTLLKANGIKVKAQPGSWGDARTMMKDRRIVGMFKASPAYTLDAILADVNSVTPIRILTITEKQFSKGADKLKGRFLKKIPAGAISQLPKHGPILTLGGGTFIVVRKDFPEDLGYKIVKALAENWEMVAKVYKAVPSKKDAIEEFVLRLTSGDAVVCPIHPGTLQYLKEKGVQVPQKAIPPEAK